MPTGRAGAIMSVTGDEGFAACAEGRGGRMDADMARLIDIEEIKQLKARYFRGLDMKDWVLWADVFTEDAHIEADGYPFDGPEAIHPWVMESP